MHACTNELCRFLLRWSHIPRPVGNTYSQQHIKQARYQSIRAFTSMAIQKLYDPGWIKTLDQNISSIPSMPSLHL